MQIGLMSVRALQCPGLWELIPSLCCRNRPPSSPCQGLQEQEGPMGSGHRFGQQG